MSTTLPGILWVSGLTAALVWMAGHMLPFTGEAFDTAAYLFLVALIPLSTLALSKLPTDLGSWLKYLLIGGLVVICLKSLVGTKDLLALLLFTALTFLQIEIIKLVRPAGRGRIELTALGALVFIGWLAVAPLPWWRPWIREIDTNWWGFAVLLGATAASTAAALGQMDAKPADGYRKATTVIFAVLFASAASRPVYDADYGAGNAQGYLLGTIDLVRQGGWLLWDVPSQYGFLNVLLAGWMPASGSLQALMLADVPLIWASAMLFYFRAVRMFPGYSGRLFCGILTLAAVLMVPGWVPDLSGPHIAPGVGAFRFLWAYILTGILLVVDEGGDDWAWRTHWLVGGCIAWALGCLWSAEGALCASAVWLPAYLWCIWKKPIFGYRSISLAVPVVLLLSAVASIWFIYDIKLGHGPDWYAFFEYLLLYEGQGGIGAITADWDGAVTFILGMFAIVVTAAWLVYVHVPSRLPSTLGAVALFVASVDYFVMRSHPNNVINIIPLLLLSAFTVLGSLRSLPAGLQRENLWLRMALVPFLGMLMFTAYGDLDKTIKYGHSLFQGHRLRRLDQLQTTLPRDLIETLRHAGLKEGDPLILYGSQLLPHWQSLLWLPLAPAEQFSLLPDRRRQLYLCRFAERVPQGGWLLFPQKITEDTRPYVWQTSSEDARRTDGKILEDLIQSRGVITPPGADDTWGLIQLGPPPPHPSCEKPQA